MSAFSNEIFIRHDKFEIHSYEIDLNRRLKIPALNRYMQESAWKHAEQLGFGYTNLIVKKLTWVLTRMIIQVEKLPLWGETIEVITWPSGRDDFFAFRDFQFFGADDNEFGRATSSWCVISLQDRRPQTMESVALSKYPMVKELMFADRPEKIPSLVNTDSEWRTYVGYQDLDVNEHVNNVRYLDWITETYSLDFLKAHQMHRLEINYLAEALYGKDVVVFNQQLSDSEFLHSIRRIDDQTEICRAKVFWQ
jgi:medium-chain acyl-[acyl-carrier-protein] hydrolase